MLMTNPRPEEPSAPRQTGAGLVMSHDRTNEFRTAARRTVLVRAWRLACPGAIVLLLGIYGISIAENTGLVKPDTLPEMTLRKILPEDLAMTNPRYEGFGKDGTSYSFTAKSADPDLTNPDVVTLNHITGEIYQADKTRTDVTAVRGIFNNKKNVLELYDAIDVVAETGLKAKLTRATILTKEDLLTSPEPVVVEFPTGSVRSKQMTLRQKAREATFTEDVEVELTQPPETGDEQQPAAAEAAPAGTTDQTALFAPSNGPIHINAHRLDIDDADKTALFSGEVIARQADATMTTPELTVIYEGEGMMSAGGSAQTSGQQRGSQSGRLRRILAKKPVVMTRANGDVVTSESAEFDALTSTAILSGEVVMTSGEDRRATSDRVEIHQTDGTIVLAGDVIVTQGSNELKGGRLAIDRTNMTAKLTSPPQASLIPGRITARLTRNADAKPDEKKKAEPAKGATGAMSFKANANAPVEVESDSLDVDDKKKVAIFRGNVEAKQDTFEINCAELSAFYKGEAGLMDAASGASKPEPKKESTGSELTRIEARTNVKVSSVDGQTATGDWADFDAKTNKVTMGGNVVLSRGKNMVRGTRLLIDLTTGESKIDTAPGNTVATPDAGGWVAEANAPAEPARKSGRASAVFFPKELKDGKKNKGASKSQDAPVDGWSATSDPTP